MKRWMKIYRGDSLLGYAGHDDGLGPCRPFEAADGFREVESLFQKEHELGSLLEADNLNVEKETEIVEACDAIMEEILVPGIKMTTLEDIFCFDCIQLTIGDGRVCWR